MRKLSNGFAVTKQLESDGGISRPESHNTVSTDLAISSEVTRIMSFTDSKAKFSDTCESPYFSLRMIRNYADLSTTSSSQVTVSSLWLFSDSVTKALLTISGKSLQDSISAL